MAAIEAASAGRPLRIMFQDEARFGRLPVIRSAWAPLGVRPVVHAAIEREFRYIYGAVSPSEGDVDWMVTESMNTENMNRFLFQVSDKYTDDYILMIVDGASSHKGEKLNIPNNMAILCLPPYSPELNPVEHLWDELREKACANVFFAKLDHVIDRAVDELESIARATARNISMFLWPWIIALI